MQGRFSGRLLHKSDETTLAEECRRLAPLLGGSRGDVDDGDGDGDRNTLSTIVRAIASGEVRRYLVDREDDIQVRHITIAWHQIHNG